MHRFYLPPEQCDSNEIVLTGAEAHHALDVLRLKKGDSITIVDGAGNHFHSALSGIKHRAASVTVKRRECFPRPKAEHILFQALPKGKSFDLIIQKAVELGCAEIHPVITERVISRAEEQDSKRKQEKWQQIAIEAMKQCGAGWLTKVFPPRGFKDFLPARPRAELELVGALQSQAHPATRFSDFRAHHARAAKSCAVWIGPEGDFTGEELSAIQNSGAQDISLGPLVLRSDTAAIYCLSILAYESQR